MKTLSFKAITVVFLKFLAGLSTVMLYILFSHYLSPEKLGRYELALSLIMLLTQLMSLGFVQFACGEFTRKNIDEVTIIINKINASYIIFAAVVCLFLVLIIMIWSPMIKFNFLEILFVLIASFLYFYRSMYAGVLQHTFRPVKYTLIEAAPSLIILLFCLIYLVGLKGESIELILLFNCFSLLLILIFYKMEHWVTLNPLQDLSINEFFNIVYSSYTWFFVAILNWLLYSTDKWFIQYFKGEFEVGLYSQIYKISSAYNALVIATISIVLTPYIYKSFSSKNSYLTWQLIIRQSVSLILFTICIFLACYLLGFKTYQLIVGKEYYESYKYIYLIILNFMMTALIGYFNTIFLYFNITKYIQIAILIGVLLNAVLVLFFGRVYGVYGILIASFISQMLMLCYTIYYSKKMLFTRQLEPS
jgi:O-antigen/teichoic acid export membrane protein